MKNKFIHCTFIFTLLVTFLVVSGCSDLSQADAFLNNQICEVKGCVLQENLSSRAAYPEFEKTKYSYVIKAFQGDDETKGISVSTNEKTFSMSLKYGSWNFKAEVWYASQLLMECVLSNVNLSSGSAEIKFENFDICDGFGSVNIAVKATASSKAKKIIAVWENLGTQYSQTVNVEGIFDFTGDGNSFATPGKIPCGSYKVVFYIKNSSGATCGVFVENVNVFPGQVTNKFVNSLSSYLKDGEICLTDALEFLERKIYYVSSTGNDNGTGSKISPLKTIQQAVDIIEAINDESSYSVCLLDDISAAGCSGRNSSNSGNSFVEIHPSGNLFLTICSSVAENPVSVTGTENLRGFYVGPHACVTFENIEIKDFSDSMAGSGIFVGGACILDGKISISDIYLTKDCVVWCKDDLSCASGSSVAELSFPESSGEYAVGRSVLDNHDNDLNTHRKLFTIKNDSKGNKYYIDSSGMLQKGDDVVIYSDWTSLKQAVEAIPAGTTDVTEFKLSGTLTATSTITNDSPIKLVSADGSSVKITRDSSFTNGAVFNTDADFTVEGSEAGRFVFDGGGVECDSAFVDIKGNVDFSYINFINCNNTENGGAIYEKSNDEETIININYCNFSSNVAYYGSGIYAFSDSTINITNSTFTNNNSFVNQDIVGVGIYRQSGRTVFTNISITNNKKSNGIIQDLVIFQTGTDRAEVIFRGKNTVGICCYVLGYNCNSPEPIHVNGISDSQIGLTVIYKFDQDYSSYQVVALEEAAASDLASQIECFSVTNEGKELSSTGYLVNSTKQSLSSLVSGYTMPSDEVPVPSFDNSKTYTISTEAELRQIGLWTKSSFVDANFALLNDITLTCVDGDEDTYFTPIGISKSFRKEFNGNGHTISGLIVNSSYAGLFGKINGSNAVVKNLTVEGKVTGSSTYGTGGIVGKCDAKAVIENCVSKVSVFNSSNVTGGICGYLNQGTIRNCINIGDVTGTGDSSIDVGGIVGYLAQSSCYINNCANLGNIKGFSSVGGLVGSVTYGEIKNCYTVGNVTKTNNSGDTYGAVTGDGETTSLESVYYLAGVCTKVFGGSETKTATNITTESFTTYKTLQILLDSWITENDSQGTLFKKWNNTFTYTINGIEFPVCVKCE